MEEKASRNKYAGASGLTYSTYLSVNNKTHTMCYHLKTPQGNTEAVIDDNCGISKFYAIANTLSNGLNVRFEKRVDDAESLDWEFNYKNHVLTLHYSIFNGVSIYPQHKKSIQQENNAVIEIAHFLEKMAY